MAISIGSGKTGTQYRGEDNDRAFSQAGFFKGPTPPTDAEPGWIWCDDAANPIWVFRSYIGGTDPLDLANWAAIFDVDSSSILVRPRQRSKVVSVTGATTLDASHQGALILADASGGAFTIKLPTAAAAEGGFPVTIKNTGGSNDVTIQRADTTSDTIDGATSIAIAPTETATLELGDGVIWRRISAGATDDKRVKVSTDDASAGFLEDQITAAGPIALSTLDPGSNEQRQIAFSIAQLSAQTSPSDTDIIIIERAGVQYKMTRANFRIGIATAPIFTKSFTSTQQVITAAGALTLAHGMGELPKIITAKLVCIDAGGEAGYAQNDEIYLGPHGLTFDNFGHRFRATTSNILVRFSSSAATYAVINDDTGAAVNLTNSKWRLVVTAWA